MCVYRTPLTVLLFQNDRGYLEGLKILLGARCDPNQIDGDGDAPLHLASLHRNEALIIVVIIIVVIIIIVVVMMKQVE